MQEDDLDYRSLQGRSTFSRERNTGESQGEQSNPENETITRRTRPIRFREMSWFWQINLQLIFMSIRENRYKSLTENNWEIWSAKTLIRVALFMLYRWHSTYFTAGTLHAILVILYLRVRVKGDPGTSLNEFYFHTFFHFFHGLFHISPYHFFIHLLQQQPLIATYHSFS